MIERIEVNQVEHNFNNSEDPDVRCPHCGVYPEVEPHIDEDCFYEVTCNSCKEQFLMQKNIIVEFLYWIKDDYKRKEKKDEFK